jgi:hypothetical protein
LCQAQAAGGPNVAPAAWATAARSPAACVARWAVDSLARRPDRRASALWAAVAKLSCTPARQITSSAAGVRSAADRPSASSSGLLPWPQVGQW